MLTTSRVWRRRVALTLLLGVALLLSSAAVGSSAHASPAHASPAHAGAKPVSAAAGNPPCKNRTTKIDPRYGRVSVLYCDIWEPSDVDNANVCLPHQSQCWGPAGRLLKAGYANWFVCQAVGYFDHIDWAWTEADNGTWGWVDAWSYAGTSSKWPLPACSSVDPVGALPF